MSTDTNRKGYIYEVVGDYRAEMGSIFVMTEDDNSDNPWFAAVKGEFKGGSVRSVYNIDDLKQLWPVPEEKVETIELMGKTYAKKDIESALAQVKEI